MLSMFCFVFCLCLYLMGGEDGGGDAEKERGGGRTEGIERKGESWLARPTERQTGRPREVIDAMGCRASLIGRWMSG